MKKTTVIVIALLLCGSMAVPSAFAQANEKAMEHADDNAIFNRVGDWFATIGKNDEEKKKILAERKAERAAKRAEKETKKAKKKAGQGVKDAGKKMNKKMEKMKGPKK